MGTESRKLAAILFADMVGFSALRQAEALELRDEMMALAGERFSKHHGRLVNTMGDGFFAEFPTAIDAVQFATGLQEAIEARNAKREQEGVPRLRVRMGIHAGEVIIQGQELYGANVNIASRCEELAAPGGICMTDQVWEQVRDDVGKRARHLGKMRARHIRQRLTFYHLDPPRAGLGFRLAHRIRTSAVAAGLVRLTAAGAGLLVLGVLLVWALLTVRQPRTPEQWLSRAERLLVNYDHEGHLTRALAALREAARLDPGNTQVLARLGWANWLLSEEDEREDSRWEAQRWSSNALSLNPKDASGHLVQGLVAKSNREWPLAAMHLLKAKELTRSIDGVVLISLADNFRSSGDSSNATYFAQLAEQNADNRWDVFLRLAAFYFRTEPTSNELRHARACCEQAVRCAPQSPSAHLLLGQIMLLQPDFARAKSESEQALKLHRTARALSAMGSVYYSAGRCDRAADYFLEASRAEPSKYIYHVSAGLALREASDTRAAAMEQFELALGQIEDALRAGGERARTRAYAGFCRALLGQTEEARTDLERAQAEAPLDNQVLRIVRRGYRILGDGAKIKELEQLLRQNPE